MTKKISILLFMFLSFGIQVRSQTPRYGIHYSGGYSNDTIVSSNIGTSCNATGLNSFAGGWQSLAQGAGSFAFGNMAQATQAGSFALGGAALANASTTMSLGFYVTASQNSSIVIGSGSSSSSPLTATVAGITMGMGSTHPTLFLSRASTANKTGRIAIGDVSPQAKLHIRSDADEDAGIILVPADTANSDAYIKLWDANHYIEVNSKGTMDIRSQQSPMRLVGSTLTLDGKVGVNTTNDIDGYALAVDGGVITTKVYIQDVEDWRDEVFGDDYQLMSLGELESYVSSNKHLPGIPSESEVKAEGYDVAAMHAALLGKIEELMLYVIRQQKEIDSLREMVTVHFGYDACGNRISRMIMFQEPNRMESSANEDKNAWLEVLESGFAGMSVALFPNPTDRGFVLSLTGEEDPQGCIAILSTLDGKVMENRTLVGFTEEFDLSGKPAGVYLLRLTMANQTKVWKIVKCN